MARLPRRNVYWPIFYRGLHRHYTRTLVEQKERDLAVLSLDGLVLLNFTKQLCAIEWAARTALSLSLARRFTSLIPAPLCMLVQVPMVVRFELPALALFYTAAFIPRRAYKINLSTDGHLPNKRPDELGGLQRKKNARARAAKGNSNPILVEP